MATYNERLQTNNADLQKLVTDVNGLPNLKPEQTKSVTYTTNGSRTVTPDNGKVLSSVSVNVNVPSKPEETFTKEYNENGDYTVTPTPGKVFNSGTVKVRVGTQQPVIRPITITANGTTTAPAGTKGYNPITVNVPTGGGGGGGGAKSFSFTKIDFNDITGVAIFDGEIDGTPGGACGECIRFAYDYSGSIFKTDKNPALIVIADSEGGSFDGTGIILECESDVFNVVALASGYPSEVVDYSGGAYSRSSHYSAFLITPKVDGAVGTKLTIGSKF